LERKQKLSEQNSKIQEAQNEVASLKTNLDTIRHVIQDLEGEVQVKQITNSEQQNAIEAVSKAVDKQRQFLSTLHKIYDNLIGDRQF
jgi:septal ring factor EnvC (AmiA/AmiB activator)